MIQRTIQGLSLSTLRSGVTNLVVAGVPATRRQSSSKWQPALSPSCWGLP